MIPGSVRRLLRPTRPWAAGGLGLMLTLTFPANAHLALTGENLPWNDQLVPRTAMQAVFLAAGLAVLIPEIRAQRGAQRQHAPGATSKPSAL